MEAVLSILSYMVSHQTVQFDDKPSNNDSWSSFTSFSSAHLGRLTTLKPRDRPLNLCPGGYSTHTKIHLFSFPHF